MYYYQSILSHPIKTRKGKARILFAQKDDLPSKNVIRDFADRFLAGITVSTNSSHPFMEGSDAPIVEKWLAEHI